MIRGHNPNHYDARFSAVKGFPYPIRHGPLTAAMICEAGGQSDGLAISMAFQFLKPVYFGDTMACRLTILDVDARGAATAEATHTDQHGEPFLTVRRGGFLPGTEEHAVRAAMVTEGARPTSWEEARRPNPRLSSAAAEAPDPRKASIGTWNGKVLPIRVTKTPVA